MPPRASRPRRGRAPISEVTIPAPSPERATFYASQIQMVPSFVPVPNGFDQVAFMMPVAHQMPFQDVYQHNFQAALPKHRPSRAFRNNNNNYNNNNNSLSGRTRQGNNDRSVPYQQVRDQCSTPHPRTTERTTANEEIAWTAKTVYAMVKAFVDDPTTTEMSFPSTLSGADRLMVHQAAINLNLYHRSSGSGSNRVLTLKKIGSTTEQQKQQEMAAHDGVRIKTIDGYQGAQRLPGDYVLSKAKEIRFLVQPLLSKMYKNLKAIIWKGLRNREILAIQPGLNKVPTGTVPIGRFKELQAFRHSLPSYKRKDEIITAVKENDVVVVSGDTGCGKTTQIPQLLYDANIFPKDQEIICTQPRRISAFSVSQRVAEERGELCGNRCGYIVRFDNMTSSQTKIVYMTTGILLRRLHTDPELNGVSCVIIDEVHERDMETDFCLLLIRDRLLQQQRRNGVCKHYLKVVIMSATIQIEKMTSYFTYSNTGKTPPVIKIPGTLFPVEVHFLEDALTWVNMSPSAVPAMSILTFSSREENATSADDHNKQDVFEKIKAAAFDEAKCDSEAAVPYELVFKLIMYIHGRSRDLSESILVFLPGWSSISRITTMIRASPIAKELLVLQLHSSLTAAEQQRVFSRPPKRYRKVVLSTNIAEASVTIDDIVHVIDSCLTKDTCYNPTENVSVLKATYISKSNGLQRRGRAGRCRAGLCIHLLRRSAYESLPDFISPEIARSPLEEVCLQVKALKPDEECGNVLSRALDAPPEDSIKCAVRFLKDISAFTFENERLTSLGRALSKLPIHPLLGKMLLAGVCFGVLEPVATIAAYLSGKSPFVRPLQHQKTSFWQAIRNVDNGLLSDHLRVVRLFNEWKQSGCSSEYAMQHFADEVILRSMDRIRKQLLRLMMDSSFLRRVKDPVQTASRHSNNLGLIRLAALWAFYPHIASIEYRSKRNKKRPEFICWDNKWAQLSAGSALMMQNKNDLKDRAFVFYHERMQLEAKLTLFDTTAVTPIETALCLRELTLGPVAEIPEEFLIDDESKMGPAFPFSLEANERIEDMAALFFDGGKKVYVTSLSVALALRDVRDCMDYYLTWAVNEVRADLFPEELTRAIAYTIGYPIQANVAAADDKIHDHSTYTSKHSEQLGLDIVKGHKISSLSDDSIDEGDAPELIIGHLEDFQFTDQEITRITNELGDLAVFNRYNGDRLLQAFKEGKELRQNNVIVAKTVGENAEREEESDDDDVVVAQAGELLLDDDDDW